LAAGALEVLALVLELAAAPVLLALPQADRIAPMTPVERPMTAPFWTN
jgi:hypothetical protein